MIEATATVLHYYNMIHTHRGLGIYVIDMLVNRKSCRGVLEVLQFYRGYVTG